MVVQVKTTMKTLQGWNESGHELKWMTYQRITLDPGKMGGVACIRGLRIPVASIVAMVAGGMTPAEILEAYPDLEAEDIQEALHFAAKAVMEKQLPFQQAS